MIEWANGTSYALPPPPPEKLAVFANTIEQFTARVYDKGVYWKYVYYVPVEWSVDLDLLWARTVGKKIPFRIAKLCDEFVAFACFDERTWIPIEPREQSDRGVDEHMRLRGSITKRIREANRVRGERLDEIMAGVHEGTTIDVFLENQTQTKREMTEGEDSTQGQPEAPDANVGGNEPVPAALPKQEGENETPPAISSKHSKGFSAGLREMFRQKPSRSDK